MLNPTTIAIAIIGYMLLLVAVGWREARLRKRIRAMGREAIRIDDYQRQLELVHDDQGIQKDGQEAS